jgi:DNA-binding IscR family transcriptional regulator
MAFEVKPGMRGDIPLLRRSIEVTRGSIIRALEELGNTPDCVVIHNKTKTCRVKVLIQSHTVFVEITNEEEDSQFRLTLESETPKETQSEPGSDIPTDQ